MFGSSCYNILIGLEVSTRAFGRLEVKAKAT
jgi:hypothetical protein